MSTLNKLINKAINNEMGGPADRPHEHRRLAVGRGLGISASILALILLGMMLLIWPIGRASAAVVPPAFETSSANAVDATSITIVKPAGTAENDLLIAAVNHGVTLSFLDNVIITPPAGWIQIDHGICAGNECTLGVWFKVAGGSEPASYTFSFTHPAELASGAILRYSGADPSDPIDVTGVAAGNSDSPTAPSVDTTVVHTKVLRIVGVDDNDFEDGDDSPYPPGLAGLFVMNAEVGTGSDPSLAAADAPQPAIGSTGPAAFNLESTEEWRAVTIAIKPVPEALDGTPPVVTITTPTNGAAYELGAVVLAAYACTDADSGIASCVGDVAVGAAIGTATLGAKTLTVTGKDNQGNQTVLVHSYTVVDTTAPGVTITTPADGATFEMHEVVLADYACTDGGSGIASCVGDVADGAAIDTSTLGAHTFTVTATDNSGNATVLTHSYTVVDTTAPGVIITTPVHGSILEFGVPVLAAYACTDGGSGIASCVGNVASGAAIDTASLGPKPFTVTATDNEGNVTVAVNTYTVLDTIAENAPIFESTATNSVDAMSITIVKPAGTVEGDLLIASVQHSVNLTITPPAGWSLIDIGPCGTIHPSESCTLGVWNKLAGASEPTDYTFTFSDFQELAPGAINMAAGGILRYSNVDPNDPINAWGAAIGTTNDPTAPEVTTTVDDTMVVRIAGVDDDDWAAVPYPPGLSGRFAIEATGVGPDPTLAAADRSQATAGPTGAAVFNHDHDGPAGSHPWRTVTIAIKPLDNDPKLKLVKTVTNDDGGTAVANDWTLTATRSSGEGDSSRDISTPGGSGVLQEVFAAAVYDLAESTVAGYTAGSWACTGGSLSGSAITLALEDEVTCTITNDDIAPTLNLVKVVINDDEGDSVPDDWTLTAIRSSGEGDASRNISTPGGSGGFETVFANAGYDLAESVIANYTASGWSCTGGTLLGSTITLGLDEHVTCTITNDDNAPTLKLVKAVTNDDGGTAEADDWTLTAIRSSGSGGDSRDISTPGGSGDFETVFANTDYDLAESTVAGYTPGSWSCDGGTLSGSTITLTINDDVTCTITNDDDAPTLKLVKEVINDDEGTSVPNDWTLTATRSAGEGDDSRDISTTGGTSVFETVFANADYDLAESAVAGYNAGDWSCDGGSLSGSTITLAPGDDVTCTIVNNDDAPTLKLVKTVINDDGGTAAADDWTLTATRSSGSGDDSRNIITTGGSGVFQDVFASAVYDLAESTVAGYAAGDWSCDGGTQSDATISLTPGDAVTCTIINDDIAPTLKLVKTITNDDGGASSANDWDLTATGAGGFIETTPAAGDASDISVTAGVGYDLSEDGPGGYNAGPWSCTGGSLAGSTITLALDEQVTCTINNDDDAPTLKLVKTVINDDGGTAVANDWTLTAARSSGSGNDSRDISTAGGSGVFQDVFAGAVYDLAETAMAGYAASTWSCDGGSQSGSTITLAANDDVTCTIVNDDITPTLTVIKSVINDNGGGATGSAVASQWTMDIFGADVSNTGFAGSEAGVTITLDAGAYSVSESGGPAGYANSFSADCSGTINLGDALTCTITNDDIAANVPTLTVIKTVVNDNTVGATGTAVASAWTMDIIGTNVSSTGFAGSESGVTITLDAGSYSVSESGGPAGYANSFSADCSGTINDGEALTCTITNDDIDQDVPTLTVIKTVINDDGGIAVAGDWTMDITGTNVSDTGFAGSESGVTVTLDAGAYTVGESGGPSGYTNSFSAGCSGTISAGDEITCTITNDDIAANVPTLKVIKNVINDNTVAASGTAVAGDWTMDIFGSNVSATGFAGTESGVTITLDAGAYSVSESGGPAGYANSFSADCSGTISDGQVLTCTITNDDIDQDVPTLKIVKNVVNDRGGTAVASAWTMDITGGNVSSTGFAGSESGVTITLDAGAYNVTESGGPSGYAGSFSSDCSGTISAGEVLTCTITNDDIDPKLTVIKNVVNDDGGSAVPSNWTMNITGSNVGGSGFAGTSAGITVTLDPGAYSVTESGGPSGYTASFSAECSGTIGLGDERTCTITNDDNPGGTAVQSNASPTAAISSPVFFATFPTTDNITFSGTGDDAEDGNLNGASLVWTSNIDDVIGTGLFFTRPLSAGAHTITLTATDSQGATGTAIRTFTVVTPSDPGGGGGNGGGTGAEVIEPIVTPTPTATPPPATAEPDGGTSGGGSGTEPTPTPTATPVVPGPTATPVPPAPTSTPVPPAPPATPVPPQLAPTPGPGPTPIPAPTPAPDDGTNGSGFPAAAIAGIILALVAVLAAAIYYDVRRRYRLDDVSST